MVRRQLMQEYAQKSTSTTLPRSDSRVSGGEFSQPVMPSSAGMGPSVFEGPLAPCADIIAPPAGCVAFSELMAIAMAGASACSLSASSAIAPRASDTRTGRAL